MPVLDLNIQAWFQGGFELEILRGFYEVVGPVLVTEPDQPLRVLGGAAYFFGKALSKTASTT